jgi:hypothetical protein
METLDAQGFWLQTEGAGGGAKSEYREWQFNQDGKRFIARIASSAGGTSRSYPNFTCMDAYKLFERHNEFGPQWIVDLTTEQPGQRLQVRLRSSVLKTKAKRVSF